MGIEVKLNSRERIKTTIEHKQPDKLPVDFGGMSSTGIHVSALYKLRQRLGLDKPFTPVKLIEPYQMLGEIDEDLRKIIGADCVPVWNRLNIFGFANDNYKEWKLWDGTPLLVPEYFNTVPENNKSILMYPKGDKNAMPSAKMPYKGYYFDNLIRQEKIQDNNLNIEDNLEDFQIIPLEELKYLKEVVDKFYYSTKYSIFGTLVNSGFGDVALVPGPALKNPKGIRDITEWYISLALRKSYIIKIFEKQCEVALENYKRIYNIIGNKIDVIMVSGADFGTQTGLIISKELYKDLFKPFHLKINNWIHEHTDWKTFIHTCGAIEPLIDDFIDAEFDILNPVQISAGGMDSKILKRKYGKYIVFWGGGVDTQKTLPLGSAKEVNEEIKKQIEILGSDGGFVFSTVHNIQANVPTENIIEMIEVISNYRK